MEKGKSRVAMEVGCWMRKHTRKGEILFCGVTSHGLAQVL